MTVENEAILDRQSVVAAPGQAVFHFPMLAFGLAVYVDGSFKSQDVHYSAEGYGEGGGVTITFLTPLVGGETVLMVLDTPLTQDTDFVTAGPFMAEEIERAFDKGNLQTRESRGRIALAPSFPESAPASHQNVVIPVMVDQAGKVLKVNPSETGVVWGTDLTSGTIGLPIEASDVNYTPPFTGAFNIGLERALRRLLGMTPQDFSATQLLADGSYDAKPYFQAMLDAAAQGEGTPHVCRGTWRLDSELTADYRNHSTIQSIKGYDIVGEGAAGVCLNVNHAGIGLRVLTDPPNTSWHVNSKIGGFRLMHLGALGGTAIYLDGCAFTEFHQIYIYDDFDYAIDGRDVLSTTFREILTTSVSHGIRLQRVGGSRPNAVLFDGCTINALNWGINLIEPNTVKLFTCSIEGCGKVGAEANKWGIKIDDAGVLGAGVSVDTCHFEGTKGVADIWYTSGLQAVTHSVLNCTLQKTLPADYPTNNIRVDMQAGDGDFLLTAIANKFSSHNGYVPDSSRKVVSAISPDGNFFFQELGNWYQNQVEMPARVSSEMFACALVNGTSASPITPIQEYNVGAVTKVATGHYTVPFKRPGRFATKIPTATLITATRGTIQVSNYTTADMTVRIWDAAGAAMDAIFSVHVID